MLFNIDKNHNKYNIIIWFIKIGGIIMNSNIQELKGRIKDSPHSILIEICDILKNFQN